jgi:hypothetical protein
MDVILVAERHQIPAHPLFFPQRQPVQVGVEKAVDGVLAVALLELVVVLHRAVRRELLDVALEIGALVLVDDADQARLDVQVLVIVRVVEPHGRVRVGGSCMQITSCLSPRGTGCPSWGRIADGARRPPAHRGVLRSSRPRWLSAPW